MGDAGYAEQVSWPANRSKADGAGLPPWEVYIRDKQNVLFFRERGLQERESGGKGL